MKTPYYKVRSSIVFPETNKITEWKFVDCETASNWYSKVCKHYIFEKWEGYVELLKIDYSMYGVSHMQVIKRFTQK